MYPYDGGRRHDFLVGGDMSMQNALTSILKNHIRLNGSMDIPTYWTLCLAHPQHGYYPKKDPLGGAGDFIMAPEISQLFGDMIGIWAAEQWRRLGCPQKIYLVECGPGRGTLIADLLRIAKIIPHFLHALSVHLVETSPTLRAKQRSLLQEYDVTWHDDLQNIPTYAPCLIS